MSRAARCLASDQDPPSAAALGSGLAREGSGDRPRSRAATAPAVVRLAQASAETAPPRAAAAGRELAGGARRPPRRPGSEPATSAQIAQKVAAGAIASLAGRF